MSKNKQILATDLDGTLIPLRGNKSNESDLSTLSKLIREHGVTLVFVTGRHIESVETAIRDHDLPEPDWIICSVGTTIFRKLSHRWQSVAAYQTLLSEIVGRESLQNYYGSFTESKILQRQEIEKQGEFKLSFYTDAAQLDAAEAFLQAELSKLRLNATIIASVDPFNGDGLLDVLPRGVSKAFALDWWISRECHHSDRVVFAGDSGNDLAAMTAGYHTIIVGNAEQCLVDLVRETHLKNNWANRLHTAVHPATSGVLEGLCAFGIF